MRMRGEDGAAPTSAWPRRVGGGAGVAIVVAAWGALLTVSVSCSPPPEASPAAGDARAQRVHGRWLAELDTLRARLVALDSAAEALRRAPSPALARVAQGRFAEARDAYKRQEFLAAYYEPSTVRLMNGPALPRVEDDEGPEAVFPPEGFQVMEELLFPDVQLDACETLVSETRNLQDLVTRLRTSAAAIPLTDDRVWDAAKLQVARLSSMGIAGFDSPVALQSLREGRAALRGMRDALVEYREGLGATGWDRLARAFATADSVLAAAPDFDRFDRFGFLTGGANPLAHALVQARRAMGIGTPRELRAFRLEAATLFDSGAFDPLAFAPLGTDRAPRARVALGRALLFEPRLSGDGTRSCASCHEPARAFTDGAARSRALDGHATLRNAPTIINAGLQVGSFYDLRTTYLEDQVTDVVGNVDEMHGSVSGAATRLAEDSAYARRFTEAFPGDRAPVSGDNLRAAIAAYIRSLVALDSRVDRALRGDTAALDAEERWGFNVFLGKGKCGTCHFAPLFSGTVPPMYQETEVEVLGTPAVAGARVARVDPDEGRFRVTRAEPHRHAFRTPSVRNVALTAPYMHHGVFRTLEEVVTFYNNGGGVGLGIDLPNQTLPADSLHLTPGEQRALVRFMRALTDTAGTTARP